MTIIIITVIIIIIIIIIFVLVALVIITIITITINILIITIIKIIIIITRAGPVNVTLRETTAEDSKAQPTLTKDNRTQHSTQLKTTSRLPPACK
jgi:hypothetical protein